MGQTSPDISSIRALVARTRVRLRIQGALEAATLSVVLGAAAAFASVYAVRAYIVTPGTGTLLLLASLAIVVIGAAIGAARRIDEEDIARRIDRASNLSDRLSTAVAFERVLRTGGKLPAMVRAGAGPATKESGAPGASASIEDPVSDDETRDLMRAAVRDAIRAVPRADIRRAAPIKRPKDAPVAAVFAGLALLAAGLGLPTRITKVEEARPAAGLRGAHIELVGDWMCGAYASPSTACLDDDLRVILGPTTAKLDVEITDWTGGSAMIVIPLDAPFGPTTLQAWDGAKMIGEVPFEVLDPKELAANDPKAITLDDDDRAYTRDILDELRTTAERDQIPELEDYVKRVEQLLDMAEKGELTKEELLEELKKAEEALSEGAEPDQKEVDKEVSDTGKELKKEELTKELGEALENNDLEKAQEEMKKLAEKMEKGELDKKEKEKVAKALEKAAKEYDKKQEQKDKQENEKIEKAKKEVRQLEKEKDQAKDEKQKQDAERRLEKKKRELEKLEKDKQKKDESKQRRALKRLHKDMKDSAEDLQKKPKNEEEEKENEKQASQKMKDAAEETGKVDKDQRKTATQKKVSSQMDDLREAMRRAKRRGSKGAKNPFGKNGKQSDFDKRARGQKGSKGAWKPGKGKGKGKGKGQGENGGDATGDPQESNTWGVGHDPNNTGDSTAKSGDTQDEEVSGTHGKGPSRRESIQAAAQKGFASRAYQKVYADYKEIVEEVMRSEKVPSSYKYYIKKYFTKIKPHAVSND